MTNNLPPTPDNQQPDRGQRRAPNRQPQPTPPPQQSVPRQPSNYNIERVRRQRQQQEQGVLYFPLWSLGLMLLVVMVLAFAIVFLVIALGGKSSVPEQDAVIRIVTQSASNTPDIPDPDEVVLATPTLPSGVQVVLPEETPVNLNLDGPALPTIAFTNTPIPLSVGVQVIVANVGDQELNVRNVAGVTGSEVLFRSAEGTEFSVVDGPQQADGFTWWQIQDPATALRGWAVANYLQVVQAETGQ